MSEEIRETEHQSEESREELSSRRDFLIGLKKWSKIVIGGALFAATLTGNEEEASAGAWVNRRGGWGGGSWINRGGGGWVNRRGGGGWINRW